MKYLSTLFIAVAIFCLTACSGSGSSSYNPKKCAELKEKIEKNEELSQSDYSEMIDQMGAATFELDKKEKEIGNDKEKKDKFLEDGGKEMAEYAIGFGIYISQHAADLNADNSKKMIELGEEMKKMKAEKE